jgi:acyl-coenzyme A thioesterase PaaI-like protein
MAVDYEAIAAGLGSAVPFPAHIGVEMVTVGPGHGVVRLPDEGRLHNHVASLHAGALFTAGETASGAAFVGAFVEIMGEVTPLAESAEIAYRRIAHGPITATGRLDADRDALIAELREQGRVRFAVEVEMTDEAGTVVAEMTVRWYVRLNDAAAG